jgi:hypothetical protein
VHDPTGSEVTKQKYNISSIPMIYVLDQDKKVIVKDVLVEKLVK